MIESATCSLKTEPVTGTPKASVRNIRACCPADLDQIAEIFLDAFDPLAGSNLPLWARYFEKLFFHNPRQDTGLNSLVYTQDGRVEGFLGVIPRAMQMGNRPLMAAISNLLTVRRTADGKRNPLIGIQLLRAVLNGPQDLTLTDTANDQTRKLWCSCGGVIAHPYSRSWLHALKPIDTLFQFAAPNCPPWLSMLARPVIRLSDRCLTALPLERLRGRQVDYAIEDMDIPTFRDCSETLRPSNITPCYDDESLEWLFATAQQNNLGGRLAKRIVRDREGRIAGWFLYFRFRNGVGRVLQLVARPKSEEAVFDCLLRDARQAGVSALWGRVEPTEAIVHAQKRSFLRQSPWTLVHSRDPEILNAFESGRARFTALEGELWMEMNA